MHLFVVFSFLAVMGFQLVTNYINVTEPVWLEPHFLPILRPLGYDFVFVYDRARLIFQGHSPYPTPHFYPPLVYVSYALFSWLPYKFAYLTLVAILFAANAGSFYLICDLVKSQLKADFMGKFGWLIAALMAAILINSYPFMFSLERGNYDAIPLFFSALFVWFLVNRRESWLWQALSLSVAIHLKIYPVLLVPLFLLSVDLKTLFRKTGLLLAINVGLVLCTGPHSTVQFFKGFANLLKPYFWEGNHSVYSFLFGLHEWQKIAISERTRSIIAFMVVGLCLLLYAVHVVQLARDYREKEVIPVRTLLLFFSEVFTIACIASSESHDYKLVILYPVLLFLALYEYREFIELRRWSSFLRILLLLGVVSWITRGYWRLNFVLGNKFIPVFLLWAYIQGLLLSFKFRIKWLGVKNG